MTASSAHLGDQRQIALGNLRLDPENPRLPAAAQGASQEDLAFDLELGFEAFTVAESIASHGFFTSEPLIAVPSEDEAGVWIVVEGNRRLTALLGLAQPSIRSQFPSPDQWDALAAKADLTLDTEVPVVVVDSRSTVVPIIGFRHISGILGWTPFAQARYVAKLVDDDGLSFAEVAKMIGIDKGRAGNLYREQAIAKQAATLGIPTGPVEEAFSLLTVAMSNTKLRGFVGAPLGSKLEPGTDPVPGAKTSELERAAGLGLRHCRIRQGVKRLARHQQVGRGDQFTGRPRFPSRGRQPGRGASEDRRRWTGQARTTDQATPCRSKRSSSCRD